MGLTDTQRTVVLAIENGDTREDVAEHLGVSPWTIRDTERKLRRRYGAPDRRSLPAAVRAAENDVDWPPLPM